MKRNKGKVIGNKDDASEKKVRKRRWLYQERESVKMIQEIDGEERKEKVSK